MHREVEYGWEAVVPRGPVSGSPLATDRVALLTRYVCGQGGLRYIPRWRCRTKTVHVGVLRYCRRGGLS